MRFSCKSGLSPIERNPMNSCRRDRFPADESPFGVRDLGGSVVEWCLDGIRSQPTDRATRGGGRGFWMEGIYRSARRYGTHLEMVDLSIGFRIACRRME